MACFNEVRISVGQFFICVGWMPYTNVSGEDRTVPMWESRCAECATPIIVLTPQEERGPRPIGLPFYPTRMCQPCYWRRRFEKSETSPDNP